VTVYCKDYITSDGRMLMNDEVRMWKEVDMTDFKTVFKRLPQRIDDKIDSRLPSRELNPRLI
jgi:hypothetical protein